MKTSFLNLLESPWTLAIWLVFMALSIAVLLRDIRSNNDQIVGLMKWVWVLTVAYSGPIGLLIYFVTGRRQISKDTVWRRSWRSVSHCYSGCGAGEIVGVFVFAGVLGLGNIYVALGSFALAYVAGYALTVGPLVQQGVQMKQALWDAFLSETASITVMEVTALSLGLWLAQSSPMDHPLFWTSLILSLSAGLFAAYPVNVWLIKKGVKEGMHDPRKHHAHHAHHAPEKGDGSGGSDDANLLKRMIGNPSRHFNVPHSVVDDPNLSHEDKVKILDSWEHDARTMSVASEENMGGGEGALLKQVQDAKRALGETANQEAASTKMGG